MLVCLAPQGCTSSKKTVGEDVSIAANKTYIIQRDVVAIWVFYNRVFVCIVDEWMLPTAAERG